MSALGQTLTLLDVHPVSVIPHKADIYWRGLHVR